MHWSVAVLVAQNAALVLVMRASRVAADGAELYIGSTAVAACEAVKLAVNLACLVGAEGGPAAAAATMRRETSTRDLLLLSIPALLYTVQNSLQIVAISNLEAGPYQVLYQTKILATAVFSAALLGRRLSRRRVLALVLLVVGVALVQLSGSPGSSGPAEGGGNKAVGLAAVLLAAACSGFSGVWFERVLRSSVSSSLWVRNLQLGVTATALAFGSVAARDWKAVAARGFFAAYGPAAWAGIALQAGGGLLTALVVKHADTIVKTFATAVSIAVSAALSVPLLGFQPTWGFALGGATVAGSCVMYALAPSAPPPPGRKPRPASSAGGADSAEPTERVGGRRRRAESYDAAP